VKSPRTSAALAAAVMLAVALSAQGQIRGKDSCRISNPAGIPFGDYLDGQAAPALSSMAIVLTCKGDATYVDAVVTGGPGENSGDMLDRRMRGKKNPDVLLRYQLYIDPARTRVFGDGTRGTEGIVFPITQRTQHLYGEMPGGQSGPEDGYSDTIVITVLP
jgi:spore coat protein U-like protein